MLDFVEKGGYPSCDFALRFGEIEVLVEGMQTVPVANKGPDGALLAENSHRMQLLRGNEGWHTDSSYVPLSAKASVLSAHVLPAAGGHTEWADTRAANLTEVAPAITIDHSPLLSPP